MQTRVSPWFLVLAAVTVLGGVLAALGTAEAISAGSSPLLTAGILVLVVGGWAMSLCLHEFAHAYVALRGGDYTIRGKGYLTLDIRRYTDIGLSFVLPVVFLLLGGIALPGGAVWINQGLIRSRGMRSLVSLAGPATNLALGALLVLAIAVVPMPAGLAVALGTLAFFQILAFLLNILPIPGLDGWGALEPYVAPRGINPQIRTWAPLAFFVLLLGFPPVLQALTTGAQAIFELIGGDFRLFRVGYTEMRFWQ